MKLRSQILYFGIAATLLAGMAGGIGIHQISMLGDRLATAVDFSVNLQTSQRADMMHDAIRGDAQLAYLGALENNSMRVAQASEGLIEHTKIYHEAITQLDESSIDAASHKALAEVKPALVRYVNAAQEVVDNATERPDRAKLALAPLQQSFADLESLMAAMSGAIEKQGIQINEAASDGVDSALMAIVVSQVFSVIAVMAGALWLSRLLVKPMHVAMASAGRLVEKNLSGDIVPVGNDETRGLLEAMSQMQESIAGVVREVQAGARTVASATEGIAGGNSDLSDRTAQQAAALEQTAASMEQLSTSVKQNADNARNANQLAMDASQAATEGGQIVGEVVSTMKQIDEASQKIAEITDVINSLAFQTNLLALNAAVEAARAGEQGRGFAVVANEVRNLAQRSAEAAREIETLIRSSVERVGKGTELVDHAGTTMTDIVGRVQQVSEIVGEISIASNEQSLGVGQVGKAISMMDQATQQNAALVQESAEAANSLQEQARQLVEVVGVFQLKESAA